VSLIGVQVPRTSFVLRERRGEHPEEGPAKKIKQTRNVAFLEVERGVYRKEMGTSVKKRQWGRTENGKGPPEHVSCS